MRLLSLAVLLSSIALGLVTPAHAAVVTFNGSAVPGPGGTFILTPSAVGQAGSVFLNSKRKVNLGFRTSFKFRITNPGGIEGADGFAFVIQNDSVNALGSAGGGIGYDGIPKSIAIEFDTYQNAFGGVNDPDNNHVSIHTNGLGPNNVDEAYSVGGAVTPFVNMSDGNVHSVRIAWFAGIMTVVLDGSTILSQPIGLADVLDGSGRTWFGFTSATGAGYEIHEVSGCPGWCLATF